MKKKLPRQKIIPGIGDAKIAAIENAALDYAELRDKRQELTTQEVELKTNLITLLKKKGITEYKRNGISVILTVEKEKVTVRVTEKEENLSVEVDSESQESA